MDSPGTQKEVLRLFESHRATPGAPFDHSHFLDYLLAHPGSTRAIYNSFSGLRRFNAFVNEIQLHFGICFSLADRDANYSLEKFSRRVEELRASPRSSLASFRNQRRAGFGWGSIAFLNVLAIGVLIAVSQLSGYFALLLSVPVVLTNVFVVRLAIQSRSYRHKLAARLQCSTQ